MKKRLAGLAALVLCVCLLGGCMSTEGLKKVPGGTRPESMNMDEIKMQFPSDSALKNQLMLIATDIRSAETVEEMEALYDEFLYNAFIYVVGPYNYVGYLTSSGSSVTVYYDNMINHMNTFLSDYDLTAWNTISESSFGPQVKADLEKRMVTPNSIRNVYPVSDDGGSSLTQSVYDARDAFAEAIENNFADADKEALLDDLFTTRQSLADSMKYDSYLDFIIEKRDKMPYQRTDLLNLAQLVKENLVPLIQSMDKGEMPVLTAEEWTQRLKELAKLFPEYEQDLSYVLENGVFAVENGEENRGFAYELYQYDVSAGKAIITGSAQDTDTVLDALGLTARNMALPQEEWAMSGIGLYDTVQQKAFKAMCLTHYDVLFDDKADSARQATLYSMVKDICQAAMELEVLNALYENPVMLQKDRDALISDLSAQYGLTGMEEYLTTSTDVLMGNAGCVGRMLGGLYGLQLYRAEVADPAGAQSILDATLCVYNLNNPITAGYQAGLLNPYSKEGITAIVQTLQ